MRKIIATFIYNKPYAKVRTNFDQPIEIMILSILLSLILTGLGIIHLNWVIGGKLKDKDLYITFEGEESANKLLFFNYSYPLFGIWSSSCFLKFESKGENTLSIINGLQRSVYFIDC